MKNRILAASILALILILIFLSNQDQFNGQIKSTAGSQNAMADYPTAKRLIIQYDK